MKVIKSSLGSKPKATVIIELVYEGKDFALTARLIAEKSLLFAR